MKKILSLVLAAALTLGFAGCSSKNAGGDSKDDKKIVIGASVTPHKAIIEAAIPELEAKG